MRVMIATAVWNVKLQLTFDIFPIYNLEMKTAPEVASTTAGAWTRPTEAEQAATLIMASGWASRKEPADGLRCLPDPLQEVWRDPRRTPAIPLPDLP
jgi:hypothetical protein